MKRFLASALILGITGLGLSGCGEESKVQTKETVQTPDGTTTTTIEKKVDSSGPTPPPNSAGEVAKPEEHK